MIGAMRLVRRREGDQPRQVVGRRDVRRVQARGIGERRALEPELDRLLVHPLDERRGAAVRDARERAGRGVVGRDQREVQDVVERDAVVGPEIGRRGRVDVAALDGDLLREVGIVFEEDHRGHHLGDAGDRALVLRVLFPEHLAGLGIENDGGGGADIRDQGAGRVGLEPGRHRLLERLEPGACSRARGGGAGARQPRLPGLRRGGGIGRLLWRPCVWSSFAPLRASASRGRNEDAKREQQREQSSYVQRADQAHEVLRYDSGWLGFNRCSELERTQCSNNAATAQPEL